MDKFICIGKNYLEHAREMQALAGDAVPERPVLFLKPPSVGVFATQIGQTLECVLPKDRGSVHHECEIVARIGGDGQLDAVTLGLDLTLRDLQSRLKKNGQPWETSKVFAGSAIVGPWIPRAQFTDYLEQEFAFTVDGEIRQRGHGRDMTLPPEACIRYAAEYFPLRAGDAVFTGTPAGVGPLVAGQASELRWRGGETLLRVKWL